MPKRLLLYESEKRGGCRDKLHCDSLLFCYNVECAYTKISCITIYTGSSTISEKRII